MAFKKGQSAIIAKFVKDELASHQQSIVQKGGKEYFYADGYKFLQCSGRKEWDPNGQNTYAFESIEAMNAYIERQPLLKSLSAFFDYGWRSKVDSLTNDQLKAILAIINPLP